ncbi:MAG: DNA polymerase III subunit beta [Candidatus Latescibacterota bacterium]
MKLTVPRGELWRGIDTVLDAVPSKPALPILSNLLLAAEPGELCLAATDLDLSIRTRVPASVEEPGSITVPARTLAEIAREWPEADVWMESTGERLRLGGSLGDGEGGEGAYGLSGLSADDFPPMPESHGGVTVRLEGLTGLDSNAVSQMINKTAFAVARDDARPMLAGVLWRVEAGGMGMVATDGHRFAHCFRRVDLSEHLSGPGAEVIVPPRALAQVVKLVADAQQLRQAVLGDNQVMFDLGQTQLWSRLIEGPYVDYAPVIPRNNDRHLRMAVDQVLPAVRRVSILSSAYTHQVRLKLSPNRAELSASSPEIGGEAREVIPVSYTREELEIGYNAQYLLEILRRMNAQEVIFELSNQVTAAVLRPAEQTEGEDYFCLLMPLRPSG